MLAERIEVLEKGSKSRVAIVGEVKRKKKSSAVKKSKRKYRLLEEAKADELKAAEGVPSQDVDAASLQVGFEVEPPATMRSSSKGTHNEN